MTICSGFPRGGGRVLIRLFVSAFLLLVVSWSVDLEDVARRLVGMQAPWVVTALLISVVQVVGSAWRWRFTAARLGLELPLLTAVREYYLATFLNQVLPGGVVGDVSRVWRHVQAEPTGEAGPIVRAVVFERASGQVVMTGVALLSFASLSMIWGAPLYLVVGGLVMAAGLSAALLLWLKRQRAADDSRAGRIARDTQRAMLARDAFGVQLLSSVIVVASYLVTFLAAARALRVETPWLDLLPLIAPVLVTMLLPITIAGWGIREGAAAALWGSVGLTPADGVAVSVAYGVLVLLGSLPGAAIMVWSAGGASKSG